VPIKTMPPVAAAAAGAVCISSSAVLMKLASTASPSVVALGRCAFALPVLGALAWRERRRGGRTTTMPSRSRWLARLAGVFLAVDLILWSHTIAAIGAGLGTVVGNLEVLIIALLAWLVLGERPSRSLVLASPVMLAGLVLVGGLADTGRSHAYGTDPALGVGLGVGVAVLYAVYILMLRQATPGGPGAAVAAPLFEATAGAVAGSVALSYVIPGERPSLLQLAGVALMLTGVVVAVTGRAPDAPYSRRRTRIIRHASAASTGTSPSKSP
jgi:drug/metabolite transporter (DMT)-like permease